MYVFNKRQVKQKSPQPSRKCVCLLDVKPGFAFPSQTSKWNMKKNISSVIFCQQISDKNSGSKQTCHAFKPPRPPLMDKINANNISGFRGQAVIVTEVWPIIYVCMQVNQIYLSNQTSGNNGQVLQLTLECRITYQSRHFPPFALQPHLSR